MRLGAAGGRSARAWLCGGAGPGAGRGLGGAAGVVVIPPSCGHRIQFKLYVLDDEVHLGNKASDQGQADGRHRGACAGRSQAHGRLLRHELSAF
ncbi:Os09g0432231 [Oryza sativa Japonica Group]|uniref:Os09g0432231 protein n=1 Tax=Oryza sativa subsp. japonica TaxID=39947 RepID=A0A0N7KQU8_ORYSJ|nr:Os09g0432231 [Oryza sativa Japonica Group]